MPNDLMSLEYWLKATNAGTFSMRSSLTQAIDAALKAHQQAPSALTREKVAVALMAWINSKGAAWKSNPRNRTHAVEELYRQLMVPGAAQSPQAMAGLSHMRFEQEALLEVFAQKKLEWRPGYFAKLANNKWGSHLNTISAAMNVRSLATSGAATGVRAGATVSGAATTAKAVASQLIDAIVPTEIHPEVMQAVAQVIANYMAELVQAVTPFVGVITSGGATLWNLKSLIRAEYRTVTSRSHVERVLSVGNPQAAMKAIVRILERERNAEAFSFSVSLGEFAGKLAGTLADGGTATTTAIGLAANVAKLTNIVRIIVRDVQEKNAANALMAKRQLTITVFEVCPMVGAYYVCCAPTSVLVNQILERWSQGGWQGEVEQNVRDHIEPMRAQARRLIREYRFVIPSLLNMPGVMAPNKDELARMKDNVGKSGMVGFSSQDYFAGKVPNA